MLILIYQFPLRTMTSCYCFGAHSALMFTALAEVWKVRPLFAKKILVNSDKCWGLGFLTKRLFCFYVFEAFLDKNYLSKIGFPAMYTYLQILIHVSTCAYSNITSYLASIILQFSQTFINIHIWDCILKCTCKVVQPKLRTHTCKSVWYYCR